ncbi:MAG TPA: hypothetical protein ENH85_03360 [Candidatus Scalindua sp.]|nr:hypothetical protein [Candidatus Scalindua sp.]
MENKKDNWEGFDELVRDVTKVGFMAKSEARRRLKEIIDRELVRQNKKLNEQCEVIVNRELKAQADRIIKWLENRFLKEGVSSVKASSYNLALKEAIQIIREETSKSE